MCPPGRDIPHPHPRQANPHRPETRPLVTNVSPIPTAHHGRTHRSAPTAYGKMLRKRGIFGKLLPARRNGQDRSLRSPFRSPSKPAHPDEIRTIEQFPVGADLCVRPAGTTSILIPLRRIRIISKRIPLLPTQNKFELPTTGGHMGPPLRGEHGAVHKQILRRFG